MNNVVGILMGRDSSCDTELFCVGIRKEILKHHRMVREIGVLGENLGEDWGVPGGEAAIIKTKFASADEYRWVGEKLAGASVLAQAKEILADAREKVKDVAPSGYKPMVLRG